jgi:hypothetical protein
MVDIFPIDARSDTTADEVPAVDIIWVENFNGYYIDTPITEAGFFFETTEPDGDSSVAIVGNQHALSFKSSVYSSAIWVKPTGGLNHHIECDLLKFPYPGDFPIIMRAWSPEHFIGITATNSDLRLISRYAGSDTLLAYVSKSRFSLPIRLRIEARADWVYAFYGPVGYRPQTRFSEVGGKFGVFINKNITPNLLISNRTGIGRMDSTGLFNFADNYQAGVAYIDESVIQGFRHSTNLSKTKADSPLIDGVAKPRIKSSRSQTKSDSPVIKREGDIKITKAISPMVFDEGSIKFHGPSIIYPSDARSKTFADVISLDARHEVSPIRARSSTRADRIGLAGEETRDAINPDPSRSETRVEDIWDSINPEAFVRPEGTWSPTFGNAVWATTLDRVTIDDARSETHASEISLMDLNLYKPWLFT